MALPIGHAAVGLAAAAIVVRATGTEATPALWIGAFIASGAPDLDMILIAIGFRGPRYHRNASHSLLVLAAVSAAGWYALDYAGAPVDSGVRWAWIVALFSHPLVDFFTTGSDIRNRGYALPLWWPVSHTRFSARRTLFNSIALEKAESLKEVWLGIWLEITHLALPAAVIIALTRLI